jgi:peptidoglycan/LPS O-acetylase OafA/YrhL
MLTRQPAWPYRYELLDGLRGLAALFVVMHHVGVHGLGHYAVMVFFVISGYCITASAEACRERGLGFAAFMARRVRRIYPPYLIALLFFVATRAVKAVMGGPNDLARPVHVWLQNLTLTQWLTLLVHPSPMPAENPTLLVAAFWSLNYEEQFYLVVAGCLVLAVKRKLPMIVPVLTLTVLGLAWNLVRPGNWVTGFFLEYWVHFALGSTLFYVLCKYNGPGIRLLYVAGLMLLGGLLASTLLPWSPEYALQLRAFVELSLLTAVTLGLLALRPFSAAIARSPAWKPVAALGTISYSLYLIHQFNLHVVEAGARFLLPASAPYPLTAGLMLALHILLAAVFWYFCERPFTRPRATS